MKDQQTFDSEKPDTAATSSSTIRPANVAAIVVTYFPQEFLLSRLVNSITDQVNAILLVDNTPASGAKDPCATLPFRKNLHYLPQGRNLGVATAFNVGIEIALKAGYTHVILFDQDSMLPKNGVRALLDAEQYLLDRGLGVAAVAPIYVDEKSGQHVGRAFCKGFKVHRIPIDITEKNPVETDAVISSGALLRADTLRQVGPMLDKLFIDFVDTEWAYRARRLGLYCYLVPQVVMAHSIGDNVKSFAGKRFYLHSAVRDYYIVRNTVYLLSGQRMSREWRMAHLADLPKYMITRLAFAPRKLTRLFLMLKAIYEATAGSMRNLS